MVAKEIKLAMQKKFKDAIIKENCTVRIQGMPNLDGDLSRLKPDIVSITGNNIDLVEISCPYDMRKEDTGLTVLETVYQEKRNKYSPLRSKCEELFHRRCRLTVIIVSSLGTVYKKSISELSSLLNSIGRQGKLTQQIKKLSRRISVAALIGSYITFHNIQTNRTTNQRQGLSIDNNTIGDIEVEEPDE